VTYHFWVEDYSTAMPVAGAAVALCALNDIPCAMPLQTAVTDTAGSVSLLFRNVQNASGQQGLGLNGFLRIVSDGFRPAYYYWGSPISEAEMYSYSQVTTLAEFQQISASVNVTPDPTRGTVAVASYDCSLIGGAAAGVQVTLTTADQMTQSFTPSGAATTITDTTGILIFTNVPVGTFQWTITPLVLQKPSSTGSANVRAGATTTVLAFPTP
jgi:hypothetical protein